MDIKRIIKSRETRNEIMQFFSFIPDELFLKLMYRIRLGSRLDLSNPKCFNEKLQWLKLYDRKKEYIAFVDKYEVKMRIKDLLGEEYVIPTYGTWDRFEDIDFDLFPEKFVLKCTHDSGSVIVCKGKDKFDFKKAKRVLSRSLKCNYYWVGREWPYKDIKPRIIAEKYISIGSETLDYKFYCFHGEPKFLYLSKGLENHSTAKISFVTLNWEKAGLKRKDFKEFDSLPEKPVNFEKMIEVCRKLAVGIPFVRVDLYEIDGHIYFGEMTFFPGSGYTKYVPQEWNLTLGNLINISG